MSWLAIMTKVCQKSYLIFFLSHNNLPSLPNWTNWTNTTGAVYGAGNAYPSGAPDFTPGFKWSSCCFLFIIYNCWCVVLLTCCLLVLRVFVYSLVLIVIVFLLQSNDGLTCIYMCFAGPVFVLTFGGESAKTCNRRTTDYNACLGKSNDSTFSITY